MEKRFSFFFIFFTVFLYVIISSVADSCTLSNAYSVIIVNEVNSIRSGVGFCESKDNRIDGKDLNYNESLAWSFCANQKTVFKCKFFMGGSKYQNFVVYDHTIGDQCEESPKRDRWRCTWLIRNDGFYFVNRKNGRQDIKKYDWITQ
ncbi:hypothetical protein L6452_15590 [Arctium lappa]|uniref:Uncharacterized protein n=1 Tax=Arctium lappa TaxID=4217 RepID=A0ACB9CP01_ARCLA|nr:hypothetical protein L6452_15590 [Arctium lappa]